MLSCSNICVLIVDDFPDTLIFNEGVLQSSPSNSILYYLDCNWILQVMLRSQYTNNMYPKSSQSKIYCEIKNHIPCKILLSIWNFLLLYKIIPESLVEFIRNIFLVFEADAMTECYVLQDETVNYRSIDALSSRIEQMIFTAIGIINT